MERKNDDRAITEQPVTSARLDVHLPDELYRAVNERRLTRVGPGRR